MLILTSDDKLVSTSTLTYISTDETWNNHFELRAHFTDGTSVILCDCESEDEAAEKMSALLREWNDEEGFLQM